MATKPIPAGTVNFPVNMPRELRLQAGRHAFQKDKSLGEWVREQILKGLSAAKSAICFHTEARRAAAEDREALRLMRHALRDGAQPHDLPDLVAAMALISQSAERDERIATADQAVGQLARA